MRLDALTVRMVIAIFAIVAIVAIGLAPRIAWHFAHARTLNVVVVDKTVPFRNYRERTAIPWLLKAMTIHDGSGGFLDAASGYKGFDPESQTGHDLTASDLASVDTLVVTDTYGPCATSRSSGTSMRPLPLGSSLRAHADCAPVRLHATIFR